MVLARAYFATLGGWGAGAVVVQPDLALVVAALAFVAEVALTTALWGRVRCETLSSPGVSFIRLVHADGWMPTCGAGSVPRLILLSQPRR